MEKKDLFLEDNGHYWIQFKEVKFPVMAQYGKDNESFTCIGGWIVNPDDCEVLSDIVLRPTE